MSDPILKNILLIYIYKKIPILGKPKTIKNLFIFNLSTTPFKHFILP